MTSFTVKEAASACGGSFSGPDASIVRKWVSDSREVAPGCAFVAIRGDVTDGHLYIPQAVKGGAKVILAALDEKEKLGLGCPEYKDVSFIFAGDTVKAAASTAAAYLQRVSPKVEAITGSVGKTTVRELTYAALKKSKKVHAAVRSFNTIIGCSLTVLSMPSDTEDLLLELGTNHFGEISELTNLFKPETVVITEVAPAHLAGFGSVEGVLKAKTEICESPALKNIIFNNDNRLIREFMSYNYNNINKISVGHADGSSVKITECSVRLTGEGPVTSASYDVNGGHVTLESSLFGMQHAMNMGFALAAASLLGVSVDEIRTALSEMPQIAGRGLCRKAAQNGWIIDEAYNANPASMAAAIRNTLSAAESIGAGKCAILGGMKELGEESSKWHADIVKELRDFDCVKLVGAEWQDSGYALCPNITLYPSLEALLASVDAGGLDDKVVLIKGSNSYGLKKAVAALSEETHAV